MNTEEQKERIEKLYRVPCGPTEIKANAVCRRNLRDHINKLLDRITEEVNPVEPLPDPLPPGMSPDPGEKSFSSTPSTFEGNSKMLQDISGKITPR